MAQDKNAQAIQHLLPGLQAPKIRDIRANTRVHVHYAPSAGETMQDRETQLHVALNLLPRMFNRVSVSGADPEKLFAKQSSHAKRIRAEASIPNDAQYILAITGTALAPHPAKVIYIDNRGWIAINSIVGPATEPALPPNGAAATFAAALAVGNILNFILAPHQAKIKALSGRHRFNIATLQEDDESQPAVPTRVLLDDLAIVGLGAVGQALCYCLSRFRLSGEAWLVDPDAIDESNEGRYILAFPEVRGKYKVGVAAMQLREGQGLDLKVHENVPVQFGIQVSATVEAIPSRGPNPLVGQLGRYGGFPADYEEFQRVVRAGRPFRTVVATVDTAAARRDIQAGLHHVIYNGWTDTRENEMEYGIGRHTITGPDECVACAYHKAEEKEPDEAEFLARLTGWRRETVRRALEQDRPLTDQELLPLADRLQLEVREHRGKTLRQLVHIMCGQGIQVLGGRFEIAPLFHVPTLVGALLAAQLVMGSSVSKASLRNHAIFNATSLPTKTASFFQTKKEGCLCGDADVKRVYSALWPEPA